MTTSTKTSRAALPRKPRRTYNVGVRYTRDERGEVVRRARAAGSNLSDYIRAASLGGVR
jgi:hypothetical protein